MTARLAIVALLFAGAACADECEPGTVDTYGFCTTDGEAFMLAEAVGGALIHLAPDVAAGTATACPDGGSVTRTETSPCPACESSWVFTDCRLLHNEAEQLSIHLASGTLTYGTPASGDLRTFIHEVDGELELTTTVRLKGKRRREIGPTSCAFAFTYTQRLLEDPVIVGNACDAEIQLPLYLSLR